MTDELDEILLEQLHSAKRRKKLVKKLKRLMKKEHLLYVCDEMVDKRIAFLESMIHNKSLLLRKPKKRKTKQSDLLSRNPFYEWYRNAIMLTNVTYKMFSNSLSEYMSFFKKDKE
jgi:hypothetical protein